jgi:hypothetical protein
LTSKITENICSSLEHDPEKWKPVFPRDKREAFARRLCSKNKLERDDDSKISHLALIPNLSNCDSLTIPKSILF